MMITWQDASGLTQTLEPDVTISERHTSTADVTEDPVELGAATTDSVRARSRGLDLQLLVSDDVRDATGSLVTDEGRAERILAQFEAFERDGTRLTITVGGVYGFGRTYNNMVVSGTTVTRTKTARNTLTIDVSTKEIRVAQSQIVAVPKAKEPKGQPKTNAGDQNTNSTDTDDKHDSTLFKMLFE